LAGLGLFRLRPGFICSASWHSFYTQGVTCRIDLYCSYIYIVIGVPFFIGGACLSLAVSRLTNQVSKIYFSDLVGASIGCILFILVLNISSGPNAIIVVSILACISALLFSSQLEDKRLLRRSSAWLLTLGVILLFNMRFDLLRIDFVKGELESPKLYEKWNSLSRIAVFPSRDDFFDKWQECNWLTLNIDATASTAITKFDGDLAHLKFVSDISSIVYTLKKDANVMIIGPGGGRDVIAALASQQKDIYGVEINPIIVNVVKHEFSDYAGRLYEQPGVHIIVDEARSYISRSHQQFDIIQASMIDTWAATSAGAFVLAENNLYTKEAFREYYNHLSPDGILSMSRWFFPRLPGETLRMVSLAAVTLREHGIVDPGKHVVVVRNVPERGTWATAIGTMLMKKSPFTTEEIERIRKVCAQEGLEIVFARDGRSDPSFGELLRADDLGRFWAQYPIDISAPTDDRPFFFHMLRPKDFYKRGISQGVMSMNVKAIFVLVSLLFILSILVLMLIIGPLWIYNRRGITQTESPGRYLIYFACLGLAFMMVEMPLVQRFVLFLGHPAYALSVVIFSLLLFSGLGSFVSGRIPDGKIRRFLPLIISSLVVLLLGYTFFLSLVFRRFMGCSLFNRIGIAVLLLLPLGFLMGMPFPLGIRTVAKRSHAIVPWVWGVNGGTSVLASVLATAVSINSGFRVAQFIGVAGYSLALIVCLFFTHERYMEAGEAA